MSKINNFSDYARKYNTNVDYSYLFGGMQTSVRSKHFLPDIIRLLIRYP